ncbi:MAG: Na/Pi symporter [Kangiellaceae bacterium]|nr:Na/Pi symporter [Kangiellaceae bacterium]
MPSTLLFVSGLGFFLYAMKLLEQTLKQTAGYRLQKSISEKTDTPLEAILTGTVSTAVLQSSSLVGLIVLALCAAGMLPLFNAIGVMIGANLGTTFTGWVATFIGFKLHLTESSFYIVGLAGIVHIATKNQKLLHTSTIFIAIGLLLIGLDLMKSSSAGIAEQIDINEFKAHSVFYFLFLGVALSAIIQSSSAVMMITLSALNIQVIELHHAAALVIGADLGTTSTILLGSIKGAGIKRQLASAHLLFNLVTDIIAFVALLPFIDSIVDFFGITDPLYSLVTFHSLFNLVGIILFFPFINKFSKFLQNRFKDSPEEHSHYINKVPTEVPTIAIKALENEVRDLIVQTLKCNLVEVQNQDESRTTTYKHIKAIEGEIFHFTKQLQTHRLSEDELDKIAALKKSVRYAVFSFKSLNDVQHDLKGIYLNKRGSASMLPTNKLLEILHNSIRGLIQILEQGNRNLDLRQHFEDLSVELKLQLVRSQDVLYTSEIDEELNNEEISSLLNLNREIYNTGKYAVVSVEEFLT